MPCPLALEKIQEKKHKIDIHGSQLGFLIGMISAIFDLPVIPMLPTSFKSIGLWVHEKKRKKDFQGRQPGFPIGTILAIFDIQVIPILPAKFRVNWPFRSFRSEEEAKN